MLSDQPSSIKPLLFGEFDGASLAEFFSKKDSAWVLGLKANFFSTDLVVARIQSGLPVELIAMNSGLDRPWITLQGEGIKIHLVRKSGRKAGRQSVEKSWLITFLKQRNPPLIHCIDSGLHAAWAVESGVAPVVLTIQNQRFLKDTLSVLSFFSRRAENIKHKPLVWTATSPRLQQIAESKLGRVVSMIPALIRPNVAALQVPISRSRNAHNILFTSFPSSKIDFLVKTVRILRFQLPSVQIKCLFTEGHEASAKALNKWMQEDVELISNPTQSQVFDYINNASVIVCGGASNVEPSVIATTMCLGVPLVVNERAIDIHWLTDHGRLASLVKGQSPGVWSKAITNAINPPLRVLREAREFIQETCKTEAILSRYSEEYERALSTYQSVCQQ